MTIFVCVTCKKTDGSLPGRALLQAVAAASLPEIAVTAVDCLSVCTRPCSLAFAAPGKWTYVIGDVDNAIAPDAIHAVALDYRAAEKGIIPWRERPDWFRQHVIARIPPLPPASDAPAA